MAEMMQADAQERDQKQAELEESSSSAEDTKR